MDQQYEENLYTLSLENIEDNHCLSKRKQKDLSPLSDDEIDQLLHGHVPAQAKADLQCTHGQESVGEASSSFEKDDSLVNSCTDQQVEELHMAESDERKSVVLDMSIEEDTMQGSPVLLSECDNVKSTFSDPDSNYGDQENLVLSSMKENSAVKITWNEENKVLNPNVLM